MLRKPRDRLRFVGKSGCGDCRLIGVRQSQPFQQIMRQPGMRGEMADQIGDSFDPQP